MAQALLTPAQAEDRGWDRETARPTARNQLEHIRAGTQLDQLIVPYTCSSITDRPSLREREMNYLKGIDQSKKRTKKNKKDEKNLLFTHPYFVRNL